MCSPSFATCLNSSSRQWPGCLSLSDWQPLRTFADLARPDDGLDLDLKPDRSLDGPAERSRSCYVANSHAALHQAHGKDPIGLWRAVKPVYIILLFVLHPAG